MDFDRSSTKPGTTAAYANILSRGSTEDLQTLYARCKQLPEVRRAVELALPLVDPEVAPGMASLWQDTLRRLG